MNALDHKLICTLLNAQARHASVNVFLPDGDYPLKSHILGFDYYEQTILLDTLTPPVTTGEANTLINTPFWVQLRDDSMILNVFCTLQEHQFDLFTLKVLQHEFTDNQRWFPRINFEQRQGPGLTLDVPYELPIKTHVKNLSVHGALVEVYGSDLRDQLFQHAKYPCSIRFNELFDVKLTAEVKQIRFLRNPSCHSSIRVMFCNHTAVSLTQVENFIDAFTTESNTLIPSNQVSTQPFSAMRP